MNNSRLMKTWQQIARRIRVPLGFLLAILFLVLARPTPHSLYLSLLLVLPGLWLRAYAAGYVKKNRELTVTGPYAFTRNPLYLGSVSIAVGFALAARSVYVVIAMLLMFAAIYIPVIYAEEKFLRDTFENFDLYCQKVPRLLPRIRPARMGGEAGSFSFALYRKHREYNALIGASLIYVALLCYIGWSKF